MRIKLEYRNLTDNEPVLTEFEGTFEELKKIREYLKGGSNGREKSKRTAW